MQKSFSLVCTIMCPSCGHHHREPMPIRTPRVFYRCQGCGEMLVPLSRDCCVYCSYGDTPCPAVQLDPGCYPLKNAG